MGAALYASLSNRSGADGKSLGKYSKSVHWDAAVGDRTAMPHSICKNMGRFIFVQNKDKNNKIGIERNRNPDYTSLIDKRWNTAGQEACMENHIVKTAAGSVRGYERNGMIEYLGIPYAQPPVGPLRFKRAVPKTPWTDIFDAAEYGAAPIQYNDGKVMGEEDCLTVNVQRPAEGTQLPVFYGFMGAVTIQDFRRMRCTAGKLL